MVRRASDLLVPLAPWAFVLLWSTGFIGAKFGLPYAAPFTFLTLRFALVLLVLLPIVLFFAKGFKATPFEWGRAFLVGSLLHGFYLGGVFVAIDRGLPAGIAALIVGVQPLLTSLLAVLFLKERLVGRQVFGLIIGFAGLFLVVLGNPFKALGAEGGALEGMSFTALWPAFVALLAISIGMILQKRLQSRASLLSDSAMQYLAAFLFNGFLALLLEPLTITWSFSFIVALLWLVFVLSFGAVGLLLFLIKRGEAARTASLFYLTPPITALIAFLAFGEALTVTTIIGMALTALGVFLILRKSPKNS